MENWKEQRRNLESKRKQITFNYTILRKCRDSVLLKNINGSKLREGEEDNRGEMKESQENNFIKSLPICYIFFLLLKG